VSERSLADAARRHLWGHFTNVTARASTEMPVIVRGDGCYVWDAHGNRYLDGLSGLFTVQVGHGRAELADAARDQAATLAYFPVWSYATEPTIRLAERLAAMAPGDLNRVFFTGGGGEAVESAWKLAMQYFQAIGEPLRRKVISRNYAYHGTTLGALSITGVPAIRAPFEPLVPGAVKVQNTNRYRCHDCAHLDSCTLRCAEDIALRIEMEGPETVAAVFLEPVQNTGGALVAPPGYFERVREICDHHGVLFVSDEVICAFGRLGYMFGSERDGSAPDIITFAKGVTSGYSPMGGMIVSDRVVEPFVDTDELFLHGLTFGGHPVSAAVAHANIDLIEREQLCARVRDNEQRFRATLDALRDIPIVGDVRGAGAFWVVELVRDQATKESFTPDESARILKGVVSRTMFEHGLICRADDRAEPVVVLSPPLIAGGEELDVIGRVLRRAFEAGAAELRALTR
jgi:adenosylmethionine-8-amino-7-oxononanoate aminotransferase